MNYQNRSPEDYLQLIVDKKIRNKNINLQLKEGFIPLRIVKNYLEEDKDSSGYAVIMESKLAPVEPKKAKEAKEVKKAS